MVGLGQRLWNQNTDMELDPVQLWLRARRQRRRFLDRHQQRIKFVVLMLRRHDPEDPVVEGTFAYYWQQSVEDQGLVRGGYWHDHVLYGQHVAL